MYRRAGIQIGAHSYRGRYGNYKATKISMPAADGDWYWKMDDTTIPLVSSGSQSDTLNYQYHENSPPSYQQPSLRSDGVGYAITAADYAGQGGFSEYIDIDYSQGITVEIIVIPREYASRNGNRVCSVIDGSANENSSSFWVMRFDNFHDKGTSLLPCLTVMKDGHGSSYGRHEHQETEVQLDIRGSTPVEYGKTYHFLMTLRASDETAELWVNGQSVGRGSIEGWFSNSKRAPTGRATPLRISNSFIDGIFRTCKNTIDELKIHTREANDEFAKRQAAVAAHN